MMFVSKTRRVISLIRTTHTFGTNFTLILCNLSDKKAGLEISTFTICALPSPGPNTCSSTPPNVLLCISW